MLFSSTGVEVCRGSVVDHWLSFPSEPMVIPPVPGEEKGMCLIKVKVETLLCLLLFTQQQSAKVKVLSVSLVAVRWQKHLSVLQCYMATILL